MQLQTRLANKCSVLNSTSEQIKLGLIRNANYRCSPSEELFRRSGDAKEFVFGFFFRTFCLVDDLEIERRPLLLPSIRWDKSRRDVEYRPIILVVDPSPRKAEQSSFVSPALASSLNQQIVLTLPYCPP